MRIASAIMWERISPVFTRWKPSTEIIERAGARRGVGKYCKRSGFKRALIVTDKNIIRCGILDKVLEGLEEEGIVYDIYDGVTTEVRDSTVAAAAFVGRRVKADHVIAVGGGSPLDCGKLAALSLAAPNVPLKILNRRIGGIVFSNLPVIAIPRLAVIDIETIMTCPKRVLAHSGIEALSHGLEAYLTDFSDSPAKQGISLTCIKLCMENLKRVYDDYSDVEAARNMMIAANWGGRALNCCAGGYNKAFASALEMTYYIPRGRATAMTMVANLRFLKSEFLHEMAVLAKITGSGEEGLEDEQNAENFIKSVEKLIMDLGIPPYCPQIKEADYSKLIDRAFADSMNYPLPRVMNVEEAVEFLNLCSDGLEVDPADVTVGRRQTSVKVNRGNMDLVALAALSALTVGMMFSFARSVRRKNDALRGGEGWRRDGSGRR